MAATLAITSFDFDRQPADSDALIRAWMPEIETAAREHVPDYRFIAFPGAALQLGSRSMISLIAASLRARHSFQRVKNDVCEALDNVRIRICFAFSLSAILLR